MLANVTKASSAVRRRRLSTTLAAGLMGRLGDPLLIRWGVVA